MSAAIAAVTSQVATFRAQSAAHRTRSSRCQRLQLVCSAASDRSAATADRRAVLLGITGIAVAAPLLDATPAAAGARMLPATNLSSLQRRGLITELQKIAEEELKKVLTPADTGTTVRLLLNDAGTYNQATRTGGADGSVVLPEELDRPENRELKPLVEKLGKAREAIIARQRPNQAPLSWADTIVLAAKTACEAAWRQDKIDKAATPEKGAFIADGFGCPISVRLGRIDATEPAPAGRLPSVGASLDEVQQYFAKLGAKPDQDGEGLFAKKPPFWERQQFLLWPATQADPLATEAAMAAASPKYADWKRTYDISRTTVTRTSYEEDFGATLALLANQGAKFMPDAYMCPIEVLVPERY